MSQIAILELRRKVDQLNELLGEEVYEIRHPAADSDDLVSVSRDLSAGSRPLAGKVATQEEMVTHLEFAIHALKTHGKEITPEAQSRLGKSDQ